MAWHSLFLPGDDAAPVVAALTEAAVALGFTPFDPFGRLPGRAYARAIRLFVTPARGGWARVIGEGDPALLPALSTGRVVLSAALVEGEARVAVWRDGQEAGLDALAPYLRAGRTVDEARRALTQPVAARLTPPGPTLPLDALPGDVRALAERVDVGRADSLFRRLAGTATRRAGQDDGMADAARAMLAAGEGTDWNSAGGRRLASLLALLTLPDGWREPEFVALRDAYQLHARRARNPSAPAYPGDDETMARVPDALDYAPVYAGAEA